MAETIVADMGANVWKVLVTPGDRVEADGTVLILEAMKMEIPVQVDDDCTIVAVHVSEGDVVAPGQPLADVEVD
jgi:biotin carboxyl carrier protein